MIKDIKQEHHDEVSLQNYKYTQDKTDHTKETYQIPVIKGDNNSFSLIHYFFALNLISAFMWYGVLLCIKSVNYDEYIVNSLVFLILDMIDHIDFCFLNFEIEFFSLKDYFTFNISCNDYFIFVKVN
jgi:hypothetical protein